MTSRKDIVKELNSILKELKLNAPSLLYKHEAQRLLLTMKMAKKIHDDMTPITRARPGPYGPRPIPVETIEENGVEINAPKTLPKYVSERTKPKEPQRIENVEVSFT